MWRYRPGHETIGAILDTFDNLGFITKDERKPQLVRKRKTSYGWHLVFKLPPGISFMSVKNKREYFQDATNAWITMEWDGALHMDVQSGKLPIKAAYEWDYTERKEWLPVPVGITQKGVEVLDLAEAPHLLVAGVPGFGKSNFLHVLIHSLLPLANIAVVDLKRLEFAYLREHCLLARSQDDAYKLVKRLDEEMERRIDILESANVTKIQDYKGDMRFLVLVIDEVAEIRDDRVIYHIDRIVRLARAVGISVVASTQRPSKKVQVFADDVRDMFAARLCYLMADEISSRMVLGEHCPLAAHLPAIKGRAIYKFGVVEKEVQTMYLPLNVAKNMLPEPAKEWWNEPAGKRLLPR